MLHLFTAPILSFYKIMRLSHKLNKVPHLQLNSLVVLVIYAKCPVQCHLFRLTLVQTHSVKGECSLTMSNQWHCTFTACTWVFFEGRKSRYRLKLVIMLRVRPPELQRPREVLPAVTSWWCMMTVTGGWQMRKNKQTKVKCHCMHPLHHSALLQLLYIADEESWEKGGITLLAKCHDKLIFSIKAGTMDKK